MNDSSPPAAKIIYIAGPMRGYPAFNFPAFDEAAARWRKAGWHVISPAERDRKEGFDPEKDENKIDDTFRRTVMARDLMDICFRANVLALLPGWENSDGSQVELALAQFLGLDIYGAATMKPLRILPITILDDSARLASLLEEASAVIKQRGKDYDHPRENFSRIAGLWSVILGVKVSAAQVGLCSICIKIAREMHRHKRDNLKDIAGYAACMEKLED